MLSGSFKILIQYRSISCDIQERSTIYNESGKTKEIYSNGFRKLKKTKLGSEERLVARSDFVILTWSHSSLIRQKSVYNR